MTWFYVALHCIILFSVLHLITSPPLKVRYNTRTGLPAGALNVVTGLGGDAGVPLSSHMDIDKISFTGR